MLKKTFFVFNLLILSVFQIFAQTLTLEDLIPGGKNYSNFRPQMPQQLHWQGEDLIYLKNGKETSLISGKSVIPSPSPMTNYAADAKNIDGQAFTIKNNLFYNFEEVAVLSDTNIVSGQAVSRNEFGISKGTFWSPSGTYLAFYQKDESKVGNYPLVDISAREGALKNIKYPMAGMPSEIVSVGVYNTLTNSTIYLKTGERDEKYLTNLAWSPNETIIYIAEVNRAQNVCKLNSYDAQTGNFIETLFTEVHTKYVEPLHPIVFLKNNPEQFIWQSRRDGYNHFYLYNTNGQLVKQITKGNFEVTEFVGFSEQGDKIVYVSKEQSPLENHIYSIEIQTLKKKKLSVEAGVHYAQLSPSGKQILDIYSSQNNAGKVAVIQVNKGTSKIFFAAKNPFENIKLPEIELGSFKTADGAADLYCRLVKPLDFDSAKHYPVIIYVYGGPHSQMVENSWLAGVRGWDIFMAEKGYVVFTLDNRGTSNRGLDFENSTFRHLGEVESQDQMTGVKFLKSLSYVDSTKIGIHGWSFGGFMTLNLMLRHPETFKVGVAGGPVTDWKYYEVMYGERYMDTPQENPDGYRESSMLLRAKDLKGRLMLIHGDEDPTVVMQQSLLFLKAAIKSNTHPDFFVYPGHGHNMSGHDRVHLHEHITRYFDDWLK
ncbi:MAG: DPP IV N-terminal domain-containing protein [Prevotellaceae bacterium]|jgi:dipeptidyl-peptidase-4|nr:DPP IV N-terminal domain-containing protein [Prevotellaceae bacterium]